MHSESPLLEFAFEACTAFQELGIIAVLSGPAAASIYARELWPPTHLDFVIQWQTQFLSAQPTTPVNPTAFQRNGFTLELHEGPLGALNTAFDKFETRVEGDQILHIVTATDSVRNCLENAALTLDSNHLERAAAVARSQPVDLNLIGAWCAEDDIRLIFEFLMCRLESGEGRPRQFKLFELESEAPTATQPAAQTQRQSEKIQKFQTRS